MDCQVIESVKTKMSGFNEKSLTKDVAANVSPYSAYRLKKECRMTFSGWIKKISN